jgi:hypothetical protein
LPILKILPFSIAMLQSTISFFKYALAFVNTESTIKLNALLMVNNEREG